MTRKRSSEFLRENNKYFPKMAQKCCFVWKNGRF